MFETVGFSAQSTTIWRFFGGQLRFRISRIALIQNSLRATATSLLTLRQLRRRFVVYYEIEPTEPIEPGEPLLLMCMIYCYSRSIYREYFQ